MADDDKKYRLVTRADFDGVVCGTLLNELELIDDVVFVEPQTMQAGEFAVTDRDITANLPYVEGVHLCFDHHISEAERVSDQGNRIIDPDAPSAAYVVYMYYGGKPGFPEISSELIDAVNKADSAQYSREEVMAPEGWALLNFIIDPRTGIERIDGFSIDKDELLLRLMTYCRHNPIEEILALPDVIERVNAYQLNSEFGELQIDRCSEMQGSVVVTDLRQEAKVEMVNRFMIYALYPDAKASVNVQLGPEAGMTSIAVAKSVFDRSSQANIGLMMLEYGGGGHAGAGTCRVADDKADETVAEIVNRVNEAG